MKTSNLLILLGVGVAAYVVATRMGAAPIAPAQAVSNPYVGGLANTLAGLVNSVTGNTGVPGTYDGRSATPWDVTPAGGGMFNNPSAYVPTGGGQTAGDLLAAGDTSWLGF